MGRKHCGKRRNCSLRAISPFPTVFSKAFVDDKRNMIEKLKFVLGSLENIVGKGENAGHAGHQHFLLFPQCF